MLKLLLERENRTYRSNDQYELEVENLKEAKKTWQNYINRNCLESSFFQYPNTGRVRNEQTGEEFYFSFNGRLWDNRYWEEAANEIEV